MQDFVTGTATAQAYEPRYIRLDPNDNVAIVSTIWGCLKGPVSLRS